MPSSSLCLIITFFFPDEYLLLNASGTNFVSVSLFTSWHLVIDVYAQVFLLYHFTIKFVVDNLRTLVYDLVLYILSPTSVLLVFMVNTAFPKWCSDILLYLWYLQILSCAHRTMVRKTSNLRQSKDKYLKDSTVTLLQLQYFYSSLFSITL